MKTIVVAAAIAISVRSLTAQESRPPAKRSAPPAVWLDPDRSEPAGTHFDPATGEQRACYAFEARILLLE